MQILPTLPTDNIYKLKAVAGLWMLAGLFVFCFWSVYWQYQVEVQTRHTMAYYSSVNSERNIVARINSIQSGNIDENEVKWISSNLGVDEEKKLLEIALVNNRKTIAMYKK
ncbi:hypothetical protein [Chromobacterium haemolyticum]|uniref:hypothetical protein n=1 Tax=Chromobacterium haemolyticum TaxID=394935 RepID=UPI001269A6A7|nr:hypothetical protein [Chromobacterium haemolyticum]